MTKYADFTAFGGGYYSDGDSDEGLGIIYLGGGYGWLDGLIPMLGDTIDVAAQAADSAAAAALVAEAAGGGSLLVNGDCLSWQRGDTALPDCWTGGGWVSMSRGQTPVGDTSLGGGCRDYIHWEGGTAYLTLAVEDVARMAGQTLTWSFVARGAGGTNLIPHYGVVLDSSDPNQWISLGALVIASEWVRYSLTFTVPALSGLSVGPANHLALHFSGVTSSWVEVGAFQLVFGSAAMPYVRRPPAVEAALCRRYVRISESSGLSAELAHEMRATPTETGSGLYVYSAEL